MKCLYSTVRSSALTDKINQDFFFIRSLKLTRDPEVVYKHDYIGLQKLYPKLIQVQAYILFYFPFKPSLRLVLGK